MDPILGMLQMPVLLAVVCTVILAIFGCRPYIDEFSSNLRRVAATILFVGILTIVVFLPVSSFGEVGRLSIEDLNVAELLAGHLILVFFLFVWWVLQSSKSLPQFLHLGSNDLLGQVRRGVVTGLRGWFLTIMVMISVVALLGNVPAADETHRVPDIMPWMARLPLLSKLAIVVTAMTVEEAFFRGFLQARIGLLASSVLFAFGHFSYGMPHMIAGVFTISVVIGRTFDLGGRLLPCMIAHGVFDAIQIFIVLPYAVGFLEKAGRIAM